MRMQRSRSSDNTHFQALNQLNERLTESVKDKEGQVKEMHRMLMIEKESVKRLEREIYKSKNGKTLISSR